MLLKVLYIEYIFYSCLDRFQNPLAVLISLRHYKNANKNLKYKSKKYRLCSGNRIYYLLLASCLACCGETTLVVHAVIIASNVMIISAFIKLLFLSTTLSITDISFLSIVYVAHSHNCLFAEYIQVQR